MQRGRLLLWACVLRAAAPASRRRSRWVSFRPRGPCGCMRLVGLCPVASAVFLGARTAARVLLPRFAWPLGRRGFSSCRENVLQAPEVVSAAVIQWGLSCRACFAFLPQSRALARVLVGGDGR